MNLLLLRLTQVSNGRAPSRLVHHQPSDEFSAVQNRSLFGEIFRFSDKTSVSLRLLDPATLAVALIESVLFDQSPRMDSTDMEKWIIGLVQLLPIYSPVDGVSSRNS